MKPNLIEFPCVSIEPKFELVTQKQAIVKALDLYETYESSNGLRLHDAYTTFMLMGCKFGGRGSTILRWFLNGHFPFNRGKKEPSDMILLKY